MERPDFSQKIAFFTLKELILLMAAFLFLGVVIGALISGFASRYVIWLFIIFIILMIKPVHKWRKVT
ncbi:MAG: hypothetical protein ABIJ92_05500 [Candidatus Aenigmatarchaeota archaeon]